MSADVKTALMQHALNVGHAFLQNAMWHRQLPDMPPRPTLKMTPDAPISPLTLRLETNQPLATANATANPATVAPLPPPAQTAPANGWLKKAAAIAALAAGTGGLGGLAGYLMQPSSTGQTINVQSDQGLLQYLQEQGYHLPAKGKTK